MVLRNVPQTNTFEEQRVEINELAVDVHNLKTQIDGFSLDDLVDVTAAGAAVQQIIKFNGSAWILDTDVTSTSFSVNVDQTFSGISTTTPAGKVVDLGVQFTNGLADAEINKRSGEIIYLDNRPAITRNVRQKEDIKIVLEF